VTTLDLRNSAGATMMPICGAS